MQPDWTLRQREFATALIDPDLPIPAGLVGPDARPDPARFAVYRNNVAVGLIAALASRFPVVAALVGADFFRDLARAYGFAAPPRTPILHEYGDSFAAFIDDFPGLTDWPWLGDVARLEYLRGRAYHAADARSVAAGDLANLAPGQLGRLRIVPHPSLGLLRSPHPVGSIWMAHQVAGDPAAPADWRGEDVLILRPDLAVTLMVLAPGHGAVIAALADGQALGDIAADPVLTGAALVALVAAGGVTALNCGAAP